jgi:hypothetical protein
MTTSMRRLGRSVVGLTVLVLAEDTGRMSAGVVADHFTFALFGACTAP